MKYDIVIVGSGLASICAANILNDNDEFLKQI